VPGVSPAAGKKPEVNAIILIGFMGAGKSSVGKALARRLGWAFEDLDDRIEDRERKKIHDIFRISGEKEFRGVEHAALDELLGELRAGAQKVVALGGGAYAQKRNARLINARGFPTVFLDAGVDELWERCVAQARRDRLERPLLKTYLSFCSLYERRRIHYLNASFRQETSGKTVDEVAKQLIKRLSLPAKPVNPKRPRQGESY
jgi:shikimate kinase